MFKVVLTGVSHVLAVAFSSFLSIGYRQKLIDDPVFDLRLFKRCLQLSASSGSGSLNAFSMVEFIVSWLKGAESRDWIYSRPVLSRDILKNDLSMRHLVNIAPNILGLWPLIVSYLEETRFKDDSDSVVGKFSAFCCIISIGLMFFVLTLFRRSGGTAISVRNSSRA